MGIRWIRGLSQIYDLKLSNAVTSNVKAHQQNYKKLSALLGLSAAFPVADKSQQVHPTTNLEIVKTYNRPCLIYDFPISLRHKLSKITSPHIF
jgi:hypothetical protein